MKAPKKSNHHSCDYKTNHHYDDYKGNHYHQKSNHHKVKCSPFVRQCGIIEIYRN